MSSMDLPPLSSDSNAFLQIEGYSIELKVFVLNLGIEFMFSLLFIIVFFSFIIFLLFFFDRFELSSLLICDSHLFFHLSKFIIWFIFANSIQIFFILFLFILYFSIIFLISFSIINIISLFILASYIISLLNSLLLSILYLSSSILLFLQVK